MSYPTLILRSFLKTSKAFSSAVLNVYSLASLKSDFIRVSGKLEGLTIIGIP